MIIIPDIKTVVLLVPRTGTGSLYRALLAAYPKAMMLYRHMEADGIPLGYDRWKRVGVVRNPVDRLWSLYKFLQNFNGRHDPTYMAKMRDSVKMPFSDWILDNEVVFTAPYDRAALGRYWPEYTVRHPLPENRKSQFLTLRPDLGTKIFRFDELQLLAAYLGLGAVMERHNGTDESPAPELSIDAEAYMRTAFAWDYRAAAGVFCQDAAAA